MTVVATATPLVSVIVPVWNVEPYLRQCLDSVVAQTIGFDRIELIAVDDGSTDGSGAILDEYAARHRNVIVIHEPNSGGPGRPRNVGLNHASAPYVFFLDGDDYLASDGLAHVLAMAERAGSDIIVTRRVGVDGRVMTRSTKLARSVERASLRDVYSSLNVQKLFRRSFLERADARFPEGVAGGEDGDLMARLYLRANRISIAGDRDVYFLRQRPGSQTQRHQTPAAVAAYIRRIETDRIAVLAANLPPGRGRDELMLRHFKKLANLFAPWWRRFPAEGRREVFEAGAEVVRRWHTDRLERSLPPWLGLRIHCLHRGLLTELEDIVAAHGGSGFSDPITERGRLFARFPHFRDGSRIPDRLFEITPEVQPQVDVARAEVQGDELHVIGAAYLRLVGGTASIELRRWPFGGRVSFSLESLPTPGLRDKDASYPRAGFDIRIDLATAWRGGPLPRGTWALGAEIVGAGVRRWTPIRVLSHGAHRRGAAAELSKGPGGRLYLTPYLELRLRRGRAMAGLMRVQRMVERVEALAKRASRRAGQARRLLRVEAGV
jgi:glycosyltransferase involved in cell wall biosynthesis